MRVWIFAALVWGMVLSAAGCGGPSVTYDLPVSWVFTDGRPCQEAGVRVVSLEMTSWGDSFDNRCPLGQGGAAVAVMSIRRGEEILAEGRSATGAVLYRGRTVVQDPPPALVISLSYVGGQ